MAEKIWDELQYGKFDRYGDFISKKVSGFQLRVEYDVLDSAHVDESYHMSYGGSSEEECEDAKAAIEYIRRHLKKTA